MTAILQITDTHIVAEGVLVSGKLDTRAALKRLVSRLCSIQNKIGTVDAVLVSGDLSDDGSSESYEQFKALIAPLGLPLHIIPGNHDAREPMRAAFAEQLPVKGPLNWHVQIGKVHMIGLDTLVEGHRHGTLTDETLTYLRNALIRADGAPVLLALHHPPFLSGIRFMDYIGLTNQGAIKQAVSRYSGKMHIVCGHIHSMMLTNIAGHVAISAPSPNSTFEFDQRDEAPVGFFTQEGGCLLHRWNDGFQTVRIGPVAGAGPFSF